MPLRTRIQIVSVPLIFAATLGLFVTATRAQAPNPTAQGQPSQAGPRQGGTQQGDQQRGAPGPGGRQDRGNEWICPDNSEPNGTHYVLYPTPARGPNTQASALVYLPPDYNTSGSKRYPVLYWLHGGGGSQLSAMTQISRLDTAIRAGQIPTFIVVGVQGLPDVRYINSKDGTRPVEDVIIKDLIPYIDSHYRTLAQREYRAIEGFSMGGYGSFRLGFKYPNLFSIVSGLAPSITEFKSEPNIVTEPFGNDPAYYQQVGPANIVKTNLDAVHGHQTVRLYVGDQDPLLTDLQQFHELLLSVKIDHQFKIAAGVGHQDDRLVDKLDGIAFWKTAFPGPE